MESAATASVGDLCPSLNHTTLVAEFAERLANSLKLPFHSVLQKSGPRHRRKKCRTDFNRRTILTVRSPSSQALISQSRCFLVDDMVDSGWTFAVCAAFASAGGQRTVFPVALAQTSKTDET